MTCTVDKCKRDSMARGYCPAHYEWAKYHDFKKVPTHTISRNTPAKATVSSKNWTRENLAWVAGFFDGEGCIALHKNSRNGFLQASQKEPELLHRMQEILGGGKVKKRKKRDIYDWTIAKRRDVYAIAVAMYPWLSTRRQQRVQELIKHIYP